MWQSSLRIAPIGHEEASKQAQSAHQSRGKSVGEDSDLRAAAAEREKSYTENLKAAGDALRLIREVVETLGPVGTMRSEEAVLATFGQEPIHEAQAIIEGIQAIAAQSETPRTDRYPGL